MKLNFKIILVFCAVFVLCASAFAYNPILTPRYNDNLTILFYNNTESAVYMSVIPGSKAVVVSPEPSFTIPANSQYLVGLVNPVENENGIANTSFIAYAGNFPFLFSIGDYFQTGDLTNSYNVTKEFFLNNITNPYLLGLQIYKWDNVTKQLTTIVPIKNTTGGIAPDNVICITVVYNEQNPCSNQLYSN